MSEKTFWVTSLYGFNTKQPRVNFAMPGGEMVQMSPAEARDLAHNLLSCADAAESDAFIVEWLQGTLGLEERQSAQILHDFRLWREGHRGAADDGSVSRETP